MGEFKHFHHEKNTQAFINIEYTNKHGKHAKFKVDFWLLFLIVSILTSLLCSYMYLYYDMKKEYSKIQSTTLMAEEDYKRALEENNALKTEIEQLKTDFQTTKDELNSIIEYKAKLEKSSLIRSLSN